MVVLTIFATCVHITTLPFYILLPLPQDLRQLNEPSQAFVWVASSGFRGGSRLCSPEALGSGKAICLCLEDKHKTPYLKMRHCA